MGHYIRRVALLFDTARWLGDPAHYQGPDAIQTRILEHLELSGLAVVVASAIALPIGLYLGHTGRLAFVAVNVANIGRAIPSLALIAFAIPLASFLFGIQNSLGFWPTLIALVPLAIPPMLTNAYVGINGVDRDVIESARGMGMGGGAILRRIEIPLALPLVLAGMRTSAVNVVATATLCALVAGGGLGRYIVDGLGLQEYDRLFAGALLVALLAIVVEVTFTTFERRATSPGLRTSAAAL
jgi:osmoprotectant transport system permease protein